MNAAIETLRKILQLESQKGFQNNCVVGGLDKAGPMWRQQAAQAALPAGFVGTPWDSRFPALGKPLFSP